MTRAIEQRFIGPGNAWMGDNSYRGWQVRCHRCGMTKTVGSKNKRLPPDFIIKALRRDGWQVSTRETGDVCPECDRRHRDKPEREVVKANDDVESVFRPPPPRVVPPPRFSSSTKFAEKLSRQNEVTLTDLSELYVTFCDEAGVKLSNSQRILASRSSPERTSSPPPSPQEERIKEMTRELFGTASPAGNHRRLYDLARTIVAGKATQADVRQEYSVHSGDISRAVTILTYAPDMANDHVGFTTAYKEAVRRKQEEQDKR